MSECEIVIFVLWRSECQIKFISPKNNFWDNKIIFFKNLVCIYLLFKNFYNINFKIISFKSNILALIFAKDKGKGIKILFLLIEFHIFKINSLKVKISGPIHSIVLFTSFNF